MNALRAIILAAVTAAALAGCGGSHPNATGTTGQATGGSHPPAPTTSVATAGTPRPAAQRPARPRPTPPAAAVVYLETSEPHSTACPAASQAELVLPGTGAGAVGSIVPASVAPCGGDVWVSPVIPGRALITFP